MHALSHPPAPILTPPPPSQKQNAIKALIEARFDAVSSEVAQVPTPTSGAADANGRSPSADDEDGDGEIQVSLPPANKKQKKRESSSEDADARLAAELQAQENRLSRGRVTRGGGSGGAKPKAKPKAAKKKSAKRVRDDDDSGDDSEGAKPKRKAGGGFQKPFNLSFPLAELCGESQVCSHSLLSSSISPPKTNTPAALPPPSGQKTLGLHQGQRAPRPERQAPDPLRRKAACRLQAGQDQHVLHEQAPGQPAVPDRGLTGRRTPTTKRERELFWFRFSGRDRRAWRLGGALELFCLFLALGVTRLRPPFFFVFCPFSLLPALSGDFGIPAAASPSLIRQRLPPADLDDMTTCWRTARRPAHHPPSLRGGRVGQDDGDSAERLWTVPISTSVSFVFFAPSLLLYLWGIA